MKKMLFVPLFMLLAAACSSAEPQPALTQAPPTKSDAAPADSPIPLIDTPVIPPSSPLPTPTDPAAGWQAYANAELGYSFKYPADCSFGPIGADCKQSPPEERPLECLCYLNAEDPYAVGMQSFLGESEYGLTMITLMIAHHDTEAYNPPEGEAWIPWLAENWSYLAEEMPEEPNISLDGHPAVRIYTPGSPQSGPSENIFVMNEGKLISISMMAVDVEQHREFYDNILSTFKFNE